jgi:Tfp pilus assembly protein PilE
VIVECPHCKEKVDVSALKPGTQSACPNCQGVFVTPDIPTAAPVIQSDAPPGLPPRTNGLAIASLVLSILGFLTTFIGIGIIFALIGLILGLEAMKQIKARPAQQRGYGLALAGAIIGGNCTIIIFLGILAAIAIPSFIKFKDRDYDGSARAAGRNAKLAEEVLYYGVDEGEAPSYTDELSILLSIDKNLTDDTGVTFVFGACNASGFILTTQHAKGGQTFQYTD